MADRRAFLSGLVSLPLIGGGVTLIGRPAAAVPLVQAAALPSLDDPRQRARYAWEAFSAAMRDLTADADGWRVVGLEKREFRGIPADTWVQFRSLRYEIGPPGVHPRDLVVERHREIDLSQVGGAMVGGGRRA